MAYLEYLKENQETKLITNLLMFFYWFAGW